MKRHYEYSGHWVWVWSSVLLISIAQLAMKWGMSHLWPLLQHTWHMYPQIKLSALSVLLTPSLWVMLGLFCYAISMVCWIKALQRFPLSLAYPLLSISYVLVYLCAGLIPGLGESFSPFKTIGIGFILVGLWLIFHAQPQNQSAD